MGISYRYNKHVKAIYITPSQLCTSGGHSFRNFMNKFITANALKALGWVLPSSIRILRRVSARIVREHSCSESTNLLSIATSCIVLKKIRNSNENLESGDICTLLIALIFITNANIDNWYRDCFVWTILKLLTSDINMNAFVINLYAYKHFCTFYLIYMHFKCLLYSFTRLHTGSHYSNENMHVFYLEISWSWLQHFTYHLRADSGNQGALLSPFSRLCPTKMRSLQNTSSIFHCSLALFWSTVLWNTNSPFCDTSAT